MADKIALLVEAEKRGILPADKAALLNEARKRGLVPSSQPMAQESAPSIGGMGGFNPFAGRLMGGAQVVNERLGIDPSRPLGAREALGPAEAALSLGTGAVATPVAGLAGLAAAPFSDRDAADLIRDFQQALTYQPRTNVGRGMATVAAAPFEAASALTNKAGEATADVTGSPALGALVKTAGDVAPGALLARAPRPASPYRPATINPEEAAKSYASARGLDWNRLSNEFREQLVSVARSAEDLSKLDARAVENQALLGSLPVPARGTRGQVTRDPVELRNEGNVSATEAGKPIRERYMADNDALIKNLEVLKAETRGKADTPSQVGESVQGAARSKLDAQKAKVKKLYEAAEKRGELEGRVSPKGLIEVIENAPDKTHYGWVQTWLRDMEVVDKLPNGGRSIKKLSLKELEDLRQAAVARAMDGGTEGHYAGKVIRSIDEATEGAGGAAYKAARKARRDQAMEFEEQAGVARLVDDKSRTDRATALEDTWKRTVQSGSAQDLTNVKTTLLTGDGRKQGVQAWRDLRAQTVQHIINEATKSVTRFENGSPNLTPAAMERAIRSIGKEKLEIVFNKQTVAQLEKIMEATRLLKTEPPAGFKGSPTFANAIAFLERSVGRVPILGDTVVGAAKAVGMAKDLGKNSRMTKRALSTPLEDAAKR